LFVRRCLRRANTPNGIWGSATPHASDRVIYKNEARSGGETRGDNTRVEEVNVDGELQWTSDLAVHPTLPAENDETIIGIYGSIAASETHLYTYTTCENIGSCDTASVVLPAQGPYKVGSACTGYSRVLGANMAIGFCYQSSSSGLQCGHTTEVLNRHHGSHTPRSSHATWHPPSTHTACCRTMPRTLLADGLMLLAVSHRV
jgi:hypothetical protein